MLQPRDRVDDRYVIVRRIGAGAMSTVYEVTHLALQSRHALKLLNESLASNEDVRNRFLAEGQIQAQLRHPNIAAVTDIVTQPRPGLVMDLVDGPNLGEFLESASGPLDTTTILQLMLPILEGVGVAHDAHIVHRDLKPENILLARTREGRFRPVVLDFGIARVLEQADVKTNKQRTQVATRFGTALYMSPEQVRTQEDVDKRADIFALGAMLYEMSTGRAAFHADSHYETMRRVVDGDFEQPEALAPDLSPVVARCIHEALAVERKQRFQDCASFRAVLSEAMAPEAPSPAPAATPRPAAVIQPSATMDAPAAVGGETTRGLAIEQDQVLQVESSDLQAQVSPQQPISPTPIPNTTQEGSKRPRSVSLMVSLGLGISLLLCSGWMGFSVADWIARPGHDATSQAVAPASSVHVDSGSAVKDVSPELPAPPEGVAGGPSPAHGGAPTEARSEREAAESTADEDEGEPGDADVQVVDVTESFPGDESQMIDSSAPPVLHHTLTATSAFLGDRLWLKAGVVPADSACRLRVVYKYDLDWASRSMEGDMTGNYTASLVIREALDDQLAYYIEARCPGNTLASASRQAPHVVKIL